jgi:hypothetical protein
MPSREQKTAAGKILMLVAFLNIISTLMPLPDPLSLLLRPLLGLLGVSGEIALALSGGLGFVAFVLGFELWDRNRVTVDEI